jgi:hypothetical protein
VDIFHALIVLGFVGVEIDSFFFVEKFFEVGKYRRYFEAPNLGDFFERKSLFEIR